jgi:acetyl-CoA synthetase
MKEGRDVWWDDLTAKADATCEPEWVDSEDPLFILYTSGSTGKPKGVLHTTGGYMVYTALTHKYVFNYQDGDMYWCTADIGWVTGHSYIVYGPLCNGATSIMFEGIPTYPDAGRFWDVVDKYKVNQFYTAPTAIRALMREGEGHPKKRDLSSLRLLGTVGEPINPEAWMWYHTNIGHERCPIVDTWWQTETGGILITPLPGAIPTKPGSATLPFFGVKPVMLTAEGKRIDGPGSGVLCIEEPWPGIMRTVYGAHDRFKEMYFSNYKGLYFTGDGCRRDEDGYYWITGRVDDVINVSGHRMGTAEVESALVSHAKVAEAAVVGFPHEIKGQGIYAYVTLKAGEEYTDALKKELVKHVRTEIGPIATPDVVHWAPGLPKTRSGKIMRRILRKIAEGEPDKVGDVTTLADPSVVENLVKTYQPFKA